MDRDMKQFLGKILGELYRVQQRLDQPKGKPTPDPVIYALLHGIEPVIDEHLELVGFVTTEQVNAVEEVLGDIDKDDNKTKNFSGFYDIETELQSRGVDRMTALRVMRYFESR